MSFVEKKSKLYHYILRRTLLLSKRIILALQGIWPGSLRPPAGQVCMGHLRQLTPISYEFGYDRGQPVDRYYIENFLSRHADDIRGRVLEIGDNHYTRTFGVVVLLPVMCYT